MRTPCTHLTSSGFNGPFFRGTEQTAQSELRAVPDCRIGLPWAATERVERVKLIREVTTARFVAAFRLIADLQGLRCGTRGPGTDVAFFRITVFIDLDSDVPAESQTPEKRGSTTSLHSHFSRHPQRSRVFGPCCLTLNAEH